MRTKDGKPSMEELKRLCQTKNTTQIAYMFDRDPKTVQKWLRDYGLIAVPNPGTRRKVIDLPYAMKMADAGYSINQIAGIFGVNTSLIQRRLKEAGWKKPTHEVAEPQGVNCMDNPKISEKCAYGSGDVCMYVCFGKGRRPCPAYDCTVFEPRGKKIDPFRGTLRLEEERWNDEEV